MKSAHWAYESAAGGFPSVRPPRVAAHEIPPGGGMKAARCAAYSAFTSLKAEFAIGRFSELNNTFSNDDKASFIALLC